MVKKNVKVVSFQDSCGEGIGASGAQIVSVDNDITENLSLESLKMKSNDLQDTFCLVVMTGPHKGTVHKLAIGESSLGRSEDADISVSGVGISRIHASLHISKSGKIEIRDKQSTNGLFKRGDRIESDTLAIGDVFGLGPELKLKLESTDSGLHELIDEMYQSSRVDALTKLLNRRAFEERMEEESAISKRHGTVSCLAILDIDHFKSVNDQYGHDAGDKVLQAVASFLKETVRTGDIVARWGGEEFLIYIRQSEIEGAQSLIEKLRERVSKTVIALRAGQTLSVTFSAGLVSLKNFDDWKAALTQADEALYVSKENGRNQVTVATGIAKPNS